MRYQEELLQAYNPQGEPSGSLPKSQGKAGILHGAAHVWIWRNGSDGIEILLQKRASGKATWPDYLDISAAGHIDFGEDTLQAALRESHEEIGLTIDHDDLKLLFVHRTYMRPPNSEIIENEFQWVYGYMLESDHLLTYTDGEVGSTMWLSLAEFEKIITGKSSHGQIVPHGEVYFSSLLAEIKRLMA